MPEPTKRLLFDVTRFAVCGVALWIVVRGVDLKDRVVLKDGSQDVTGVVTLRDDEILVRSAGGRVEALPLADVAVDAHGDPRITYGLISSWSASAKEFLLAAVGVFALVPFLQAYRIRLLLGARDIDLSYGAALKLSFAGNFLNFAAPFGSTAGDVFKAYYVSLYTEKKTEAMTIVFLDRIIGLVTLVMIVSFITVLCPTDGRLAPLRSYMLALSVAGATATVAYFAPPIRRWVRWERLLARLPMAEQLLRVDRTTVALAKDAKHLAAAVASTVVLQTIAALSFVAVAVAVGLTVHTGVAADYYAYFSAGELVRALPGPPQGLGTMELAYGYFFAPFGNASQILCAAFSIRLVMLVCSLPGLLVTVLGAHKPAAATGTPCLGAAALQPE